MRFRCRKPWSLISSWELQGLGKAPQATPESTEVGRVLSHRPHNTVLTSSCFILCKGWVRRTQGSLSSPAHSVCFLLCPLKVSLALASVSFMAPLHLFTPPFPITSTQLLCWRSHGFLQASLSSSGAQITGTHVYPRIKTISTANSTSGNFLLFSMLSVNMFMN